MRWHADDEEFCPRCGRWRPNLLAKTGWCGYCTADTQEDYIARQCKICNRIIAMKDSRTGAVCSTCRGDNPEAKAKRAERYRASKQ